MYRSGWAGQKVGVIDVIESRGPAEISICLGGRGAAPPEYCGSPTGYRLMLKRQSEGKAM
jgi:hypothetical protein